MNDFWKVKTLQEASNWAARDAIRRAENIERKLAAGEIAADKIAWARASAENYRAIANEEFPHA